MSEPKFMEHADWPRESLAVEVARLQAQLAEVQAESEGRRQELVRASEERRAEWIRAEQAEAERDVARAERDTYRLDIATVCHLSEDPKIVATLTRDQLLDGLREQCVVRVDEAEAELDRARQQVETGHQELMAMGQRWRRWAVERAEAGREDANMTAMMCAEELREVAARLKSKGSSCGV